MSFSWLATLTTRIEAALVKSNLPAVLVANKCDSPESVRQVDTQRVANHDYFKACVATYNLSSNSPERARACLHTILRAAVANRKGKESLRSPITNYHPKLTRPIGSRPASYQTDHISATCGVSGPPRSPRVVHVPASQPAQQAQPRKLRAVHAARCTSRSVPGVCSQPEARYLQRRTIADRPRFYRACSRSRR